MPKLQDKILVLSSYLFFVPALYIILTEKRYDNFCAYQASQAFVLWIIFMVLHILLPALRCNLLFQGFLWILIASIGILSVIKTDLRIPILKKIGEALC